MPTKLKIWMLEHEVLNVVISSVCWYHETLSIWLVSVESNLP